VRVLLQDAEGLAEYAVLPEEVNAQLVSDRIDELKRRIQAEADNEQAQPHRKPDKQRQRRLPCQDPVSALKGADHTNHQ